MIVTIFTGIFLLFKIVIGLSLLLATGVTVAYLKLRYDVVRAEKKIREDEERRKKLVEVRRGFEEAVGV